MAIEQSRLRKQLLGALCGVAMLSIPAQAWAACSTSDLGGTWQVYVLLTTDFAGSETVRCVFKLKKDGTVRDAGSCSFDDGSKKSVDGGSIKISKTCTMKGSVNITDDLLAVGHAKMAKDKNHFSGIGTFQDFFRAYFTAVKK